MRLEAKDFDIKMNKQFEDVAKTNGWISKEGVLAFNFASRGKAMDIQQTVP